MNCQIQCDNHPGDGGVTEELSEAEESSCSVVVGVEESKRLLLENEEDGVDEFEVLGEVVQLFKLEGL